MPQHLLHIISTDTLSLRYCDVCLAKQFGDGKTWAPTVDSICPGDDDEPPTSIRRRGSGPRLPKPSPSVRVRELEPA